MKEILFPYSKSYCTWECLNALWYLKGPTWNLEGEKRAYVNNFCLWKHLGTSLKYIMFKDMHLTLPKWFNQCPQTNKQLSAQTPSQKIPHYYQWQLYMQQKPNQGPATFVLKPLQSRCTKKLKFTRSHDPVTTRKLEGILKHPKHPEALVDTHTPCVL